MIRKADCALFPFNFLFVVLLTAQFSSQPAIADSDRDHFDGSEYNASNFKDIDFSKEDYKELRPTKVSARLAKGNDGSLIKKESEKRHREMGITPAGAGGESAKKNGLSAQEKLPPVTDLPSDWVPNSLVITSNGGFEVIPDNGSPVPYRLNGHVDIERGRP